MISAGIITIAVGLGLWLKEVLGLGVHSIVIMVGLGLLIAGLYQKLTSKQKQEKQKIGSDRDPEKSEPENQK